MKHTSDWTDRPYSCIYKANAVLLTKMQELVAEENTFQVQDGRSYETRILMYESGEYRVKVTSAPSPDDVLRYTESMGRCNRCGGLQIIGDDDVFSCVYCDLPFGILFDKKVNRYSHPEAAEVYRPNDPFYLPYGV